MKIRVTFKRLPAGGKFMRGNRCYVRYNSKGSVWAEGNRVHDYWLPKFIWDKL